MNFGLFSLLAMTLCLFSYFISARCSLCRMLSQPAAPTSSVRAGGAPRAWPWIGPSKLGVWLGGANFGFGTEKVCFSVKKFDINILSAPGLVPILLGSRIII